MLVAGKHDAAFFADSGGSAMTAFDGGDPTYAIGLQS
jgi:hypothetical protein